MQLGIYFDFKVTGSQKVLLSLHNTPMPAKNSKDSTYEYNVQSGPISLLVRIDQEEYQVLPNASGILSVGTEHLDPCSSHTIRVIAPMVAVDSIETLQIEGIFIDKKGSLLPLTTDISSNDDVSLLGQEEPLRRRKLLEIVTDLLTAQRGRRIQTDNLGSMLSGVLGWEYLVGEMFDADHVTVGVDGQCLIRNCIGGRGTPSGLADVFFQK